MSDFKRIVDVFGNELLVKVLPYLVDGARKKVWLQDDKGDVYLYKWSKHHPSGEPTYESTSEYLAMRIGDSISVPVVPIVLLKDGILSKVVESLGDLYNFLVYSEVLTHSFHLSSLRTYTVRTLLSDRNKYQNECIRMLLFDILIGNSDRHPGNFGYTTNGFYPVYDNGSSLCAYVRDEDIPSILRDSRRFNAVCDTRSRPVIMNETRLTHHKLLSQLYSEFPFSVMNFKSRLCNLDIEELVQGIPIPEIRKELLIKYLTVHKQWFYDL